MTAWLDQNPMVLAVVAAALLAAALVLLAAWLLSRRLRRRETARRVLADRQRLDLELLLGEQTERLRIIRELHEVSVHDLTVMVGQADGARYAAEADAAVAVRIAGGLGEMARSTLADLRRVMTVVREGEAATERHPRLNSVRALLDAMGDAGLRITLEETGEPWDLRPGAEFAIYRILHESLANALKHGGDGTQVTVSITWTEEGFQLRVDDDGARNRLRLSGLNPNDASAHRQGEIADDLLSLTGVISGAGITGMKERTELFGGVFTSTVIAGVGFSVAASFPSIRYHNGVHGVNLE